MSMFVSRKVIAELTGLTLRTVYKDAEKFQWRTQRRPPCTFDFFNVEDVERTYGMVFSAERLALAAQKFNRLAVFESE